MTAILWHGPTKRLYTDSAIYKDGELFFACNKAAAFIEPMELRDPEWESKIPFYGYTYSGDRHCVEALIAQMDHDRGSSHAIDGAVHLQRLINAYHSADHLGLLNDHTNFTAIFFGVEYNLVFSTASCAIAMELHPVDKTIALGSGRVAILGLLRKTQGNADPLRVMHHTMSVVENCGGQIYVFELSQATGEPKFNLCGVGHEPSELEKRMAFSIAEMPCNLDLILNPVVVEEARQDNLPGRSVFAEKLKTHVEERRAATVKAEAAAREPSSVKPAKRTRTRSKKP